MAILGNRRDGSPTIINDDSTTSKLRHIPFTQQRFDENFLQELIRENPEILPISDIDDNFGPPISIGREVVVSSGYIDNLLISPQGNLTIVETKLWRNPEARRVVVGQIIDYAENVSKWTFDNLDKSVKEYSKQYNNSDDGVIEILRKVENIDASEEPDIIDNISRNLNKGRFLLLVVGDGIRESVEAMADYLQQTPQLQFTLALVELQVYEIGEEGQKPLLVIPQIVARTREVVRAVVKVEGAAVESIQVSVNTEEVDIPDREPGKRFTITEDEYNETLSERVNLEAVNIAKRIRTDAQNLGCFIDWKQGSYVVKLMDPGGSGQKLSIFVVPTNGRTYVTSELHNQLGMLSLPQEISHELATESAKLFKNCNEVTKHPGDWSRQVNLSEIDEHYDEFMSILEATVDKIRKASHVE